MPDWAALRVQPEIIVRIDELDAREPRDVGVNLDRLPVEAEPTHGTARRRGAASGRFMSPSRSQRESAEIDKGVTPPASRASW